jgi:ribonuclease HI
MTPDKHVLGEHFKFSQMPREAVAGTIVAFTDGSCFPNPGPGGWGVRMIWGEWGREAYGGAEEQTNNTMELTAVRIALGLRSNPRIPMLIYTDSQYTMNALTRWVGAWVRNNWRTSTGSPVKNRQIIEPTAALVTPNVSIRWVKGHAGNEHNERVDALAAQGRREFGG